MPRRQGEQGPAISPVNRRIQSGGPSADPRRPDLEGLEFLGDEEIEFEPDEDFFEFDTRKDREGERRTDRPLGGRLYVAS